MEGHRNCASVLQEEARTLLDNPSILDSDAQEELLSFVDVVFTDEDNKMLDNPISDEDVKASLVSANRNSSPGSDGLTYLTYLTCWEALGHHLSEVLREIVSSGKLPEKLPGKFNKDQGQEKIVTAPDRFQNPVWSLGRAPQEN